ncbi:MAG: HDOD domain-containing protein [Candidatus Caenarcaniphilales bacterium]|jgi:HD-like signal output (HDOD) protein|nr:HDOD domain-containing protein [Candidatus Caenarcaniphilales bacterium]
MADFRISDFVKHSNDLATISPAAVELINKINLPSTSKDEVARLVSKDEVLFANVFKVVNSAALSLVRRPKTIQEAVDILGTTQIRNLIFSVAAKRVVADTKLWYRSVFTALVAEKIAKEFKIDTDKCSDIYIAGLSQALGEMIFKTFYRHKYEQVEDIRPCKAREAKEIEIFGFSGTEVACAISRNFQLPESIVKILESQSLAWHDEKFTKVNAILDLAISLAEINEDEIDDQESIDALINYPMLNRFELTDIVINPALVKLFHEETKRFVAF